MKKLEKVFKFIGDRRKVKKRNEMKYIILEEFKKM